jgi:hypothetical protein
VGVKQKQNQKPNQAFCQDEQKENCAVLTQIPMRLAVATNI